jgi:hypothetical protein
MQNTKEAASEDRTRLQENSKAAKHKRKSLKSINEITDDFLGEIRSLKFAQKETAKVLIASVEKHSHAFTKLVEEFKSTDGNDLNTKTFSIPVDKFDEVTRVVKDLAASAGSIPLSYRGLFLVLISKWDAFFGSLLRWVYTARPEIIDSSARAITFADLKQINSIEQAKYKIIEDEISTVLRDSHDDQFIYLERKINRPLRKLDIWPAFIEITQRRNLLAHTDGLISSQYLQICRQNNVELEKDIDVGTELQIGSKYFQKTCDCLAEIGLKLSQVLWRQLRSTEVGKAESHLLHTTFEMIKAEQYDLAIRILDFALTPPMRFEDGRSRCVCIVNLAQAHKWSGNIEKCLETVNAEDWSARSLDLLVAVAILKDDFDQAAILMRKIGVSGEIKKEDYQNWPLFKEFRNTSIFRDAFSEIFKTEFEIPMLPDMKSALSINSTEPELLATFQAPSSSELDGENRNLGITPSAKKKSKHK